MQTNATNYKRSFVRGKYSDHTMVTENANIIIMYMVCGCNINSNNMNLFTSFYFRYPGIVTASIWQVQGHQRTCSSEGQDRSFHGYLSFHYHYWLFSILFEATVSQFCTPTINTPSVWGSTGRVRKGCALRVCFSIEDAQAWTVFDEKANPNPRVWWKRYDLCSCVTGREEWKPSYPKGFMKKIKYECLEVPDCAWV